MSQAHVKQRRDLQWQVQLHVSGHKSPRIHPLTHATCEAAEYWLEGKLGRAWVQQVQALRIFAENRNG